MTWNFGRGGGKSRNSCDKIYGLQIKRLVATTDNFGPLKNAANPKTPSPPIITEIETRSHKASAKKPVADAIILLLPNPPSKFPNPGKQEKIRPCE
ncbi:hypothetical protein NPIL_578331 [Nephila pilipes]|uniref:Uncharacterized protein n=1 Tax=Nephila pilipes TaxID=299642 RepID=A0A8X6P8Y1_NEPPI|nr:hypothetical protein NPIL_578331 [Nephila pilipes]